MARGFQSQRKMFEKKIETSSVNKMKYLIKIKTYQIRVPNDGVIVSLVVWNLWMDDFNLMIVPTALPRKEKP